MTDTPITASPYRTTEQAAMYLHLSPKSLNNMRVLGTGPRYSKAGGRILYHVEDIENYIVRAVLKPEVA